MLPHDIDADTLEAMQLREHAHVWIDSLIASGITENAAVSAIHLTLVERILVKYSVTETATWLRSLARDVDVHGAKLQAGWRGEH